MQELVTALTALFGIVEKGGVAGVLIIAVGGLIWDRMRMVKRMELTFNQRDKARMIQIRYKGALDNAKIVVDVSDIIEMFANKGITE